MFRLRTIPRSKSSNGRDVVSVAESTGVFSCWAEAAARENPRKDCAQRESMKKKMKDAGNVFRVLPSFF